MRLGDSVATRRISPDAAARRRTQTMNYYYGMRPRIEQILRSTTRFALLR